MALAVAPHPRAVSKLLMENTRRYLASGTAANVLLGTVVGGVVTNPIAFTGTVSWAAGVPRSATATATLRKAATPVTSKTVAVNTTTGAISDSFAANVTTAGGHTIVVTLDGAATASDTSNSFTMS